MTPNPKSRTGNKKLVLTIRSHPTWMAHPTKEKEGIILIVKFFSLNLPLRTREARSDLISSDRAK